MQTIKNTYNNIKPQYPIETFAPLERILFIDIETTGLSACKSQLYLIGCGYFTNDSYNTIQWFADTPADESSILAAFYDYISNRFDCLIHYNGNHFDIPYLNQKSQQYNQDCRLNSLNQIDMYTMIKPYKKLLNLQSLRQRDIEQFLSVFSDDPYNGRELISVYHKYLASSSTELFNSLTYHNSEDLIGMAKLLPILHYVGIENTHFTYIAHTLHEYTDYEGNPQKEIIITLNHNVDIPVSFITKHDNTMLNVKADHTALLRLPILKLTLKKYYDNYKDYYYLPYEDCCILKVVASGVDKSRLEKAKKETCYTKHSGLFIPSLSSDATCGFKSDYKSSSYFIPYTDNISSIFTCSSNKLLNYFF